MGLFLDAQLLLHLGGVSEEFVELHDLLPVDDSDVGLDLVERSSKQLLGFFFVPLGCYEVGGGHP
jgi:hypothetical protein